MTNNKFNLNNQMKIILLNNLKRMYKKLFIKIFLNKSNKIMSKKYLKFNKCLIFNKSLICPSLSYKHKKKVLFNNHKMQNK